MPQHNRINRPFRPMNRTAPQVPPQAPIDSDGNGQTASEVPFWSRGGVWAVIVILLGLGIIGAIVSKGKGAAPVADPVKAVDSKTVISKTVIVDDTPKVETPAPVKVNTTDGTKIKGNSGPVIINNGTITSNSNNSTVVQQTTVVQQKTVYVEVPVERKVIVAVPVPSGTPVKRGGDCDDLKDQHDATVATWQKVIFNK